MSSGRIIVEQSRRAQFGEHPTSLLGLHAQLERDFVDRRERSFVCRGQAPQVNQRFEQRWFKPLYFWVVHKFVVDTKPAAHDAPPRAGRGEKSVKSLSRTGSFGSR